MIERPSYLSCKEAQRAGTVQAGEEEVRGEPYQCVSIAEGRVQEDRTRVFSVVPSARTRGNSYKLEHKEVPSKHQEALFFCAGDKALE